MVVPETQVGRVVRSAEAVAGDEAGVLGRRWWATGRRRSRLPSVAVMVRVGFTVVLTAVRRSGAADVVDGVVGVDRS